MKKKCSCCNIEKDLNEFYIDSKQMKKYGEHDIRSYRKECKECFSIKSKKRYKKTLKKHNNGLYFVYFIYNKHNELIYIGKTRDLIIRLKQHERENRLYRKDIGKIEYELVNSECDASVREIYYINKYKPELNCRDCFKGEMVDTVINELHKYKIIYKDYDDFVQQVKNDINNYKKPIKNKTSKPVLKLDPKTKKILEEYESCKQAEKKNNISPGNVSKAAKRGSKSGGFYWQYKFLSDKDTDRYGH